MKSSKKILAGQIKPINIVDKIMGGKKTTWSFEFINRRMDGSGPIMFVTPFLSECERAAMEIKSQEMFIPNNGKTP